MLIAGVVLSASAIALLARRLQEAGQLELAVTVGSALDANRHELQLASREEAKILGVLRLDCPPALRPLRRALQARA